jgi:hypothetical protein
MPVIDQRVVTKIPVERFPFFVVPQGKTGSVTSSSFVDVTVKMDDFIEGCEPWNNKVYCYTFDQFFEEFDYL